MTIDSCINPSEIQEGDLVEYVHGDASPLVVSHVARCPFCAEQVEELKIVDARLLLAFYRQDCPSPEMLADFCLGLLPDVEKLRVAAHVRKCSACAQEVASVRDLGDEVPDSLLVRLQESLALALVARQVASPAVALRGRKWRGRFERDDLIITVLVQQGTLSGRLRRRVVQEEIEYEGHVWALCAEASTEDRIPSSVIDGRGHFAFEALAAGHYSLLIEVDDVHITLDEMIEIGQRA